MACAAELFVRCLENEGVEYVFGIPGEETLDLNEALDRSGSIQFVPVRHEQGAAFMADAYGRLTGRAGVCLGTLGPGATNLVTGIADAYLDRAPVRRRRSPQIEPIAAELHRAAELLQTCERPVILAGNGVVRQQAAPALRRFCEQTGLNVITTFMGKGVVDADDPHSLFTAGLRAQDYPKGFMGRADLVVCVGYDLVEWSPVAWNPRGDRHIICIDTVAAEVDQYYVPEVALKGDFGNILPHLGNLVSAKPPARLAAPPYQELLRAALEQGSDDAFPVKPQRVLRDLRELMAPEDVLISDVGAHKLWVSRLWPTTLPNTVLISNGAAAMGFAVPAAVAARLVLPEHRRVVPISGGGGVFINFQGVQT